MGLQVDLCVTCMDICFMLMIRANAMDDTAYVISTCIVHNPRLLPVDGGQVMCLT